MKTKTFYFKDFLAASEFYHIARVSFGTNRTVIPHDHNYCEIFMVEKGSGYHYVNGQKLLIDEGCICMIRPEDAHVITQNKREEITFVNISFDIDTLNYFHKRYYSNTPIYFWTKSQVPYSLKLPSHIHKRISSRVNEAMNADRSYLQLDSLLLFIFRMLEYHDVQNVRECSGEKCAPLWLSKAISEYNSPTLFMGGVDSFVRLCDRNISYINRTVKTHYNITLTNLLNDTKLKYAQVQLALTDMPTKEICHNCGFQNMGHFYKIFKSRYNASPMEYRRINQELIYAK